MQDRLPPPVFSLQKRHLVPQQHGRPGCCPQLQSNTLWPQRVQRHHFAVPTRLIYFTVFQILLFTMGRCPIKQHNTTSTIYRLHAGEQRWNIAQTVDGLGRQNQVI